MEVFMDNAILKKKLNTFKTNKGSLKNVSDEVVLEVLRAWEHWSGATSGLNREIGLSKMQLVTMIQKAKRLVKKGMVPADDFKEVKIADANAFSNLGSSSGIEVAWDNGKLIRFSQVDQLIDFLKKAA
jgi:hypothetical protein